MANMTNQLRAVLYDIRMDTMGYAKNNNINGRVKRCPYCGEVWTLGETIFQANVLHTSHHLIAVQGCEGGTYCGNNVFNIKEAANNGVMATFTFRLRTGAELESFTIENSGERKVRDVPATPGAKKAGCGRKINWSKMAPVDLPQELAEAVMTVNTMDVNVLPRSASNVKRRVGNMISEAGSRLGFGN